MKSTELKRELSKKFNIPVSKWKVQNDHGWIRIGVEKVIENVRERIDFCREIEEAVVGLTEVSTYLADDGYNTEQNRILIDLF